MQQETLRARPRVTSGSRPSKRLRREGQVTAVVYGKDLDSVPVVVDGRDLYAVLHTDAGLNALINLEVEGVAPVLTVPREIQRDPVRNDIMHVDFIKVSLVEIEAEVGIDFTGVPIGVREEGGFVEMIETTVMISALPSEIPPSIVVDISDLVIGDTLKVEDLPIIGGVTYAADPDRPLATVVLPAIVEEEEEEVVEGEELAEGEEPAVTEEGAEEAGQAGGDDEG